MLIIWRLIISKRFGILSCGVFEIAIMTNDYSLLVGNRCNMIYRYISKMLLVLAIHGVG